MSINQLIAGGIQLPRFESPMNMMAQLSQLESAREANELRKMQMAQMQRQQEQEMGLMNALQSGQPLSFQQALLGGRTGLSAFELQQGQLEAQRKRTETERLQRAVPFAVAAQRAVNTPVESLEESDALLSGARHELASLGISSPEIDGKFASLKLLGTPEARREGLMTLVSSIPGLEEMLTAQSQKRAAVEKTEAETRKLNVEIGQVGRPQQFAPPEIVRLIAERDALPKGSPARAELQTRIEALNRPQQFAPPEIVRLISERDALPKGSTARAELQTRINALGTPTGTTIKMAPGESAFSQAVGAGLGKEAVAEIGAARAAPAAADRANNILRAVNENKAFTGTAADFKLQLARVLNIGGGTTSEIVAATETLVADLKQSVIDAIRASNLGTGNGFTNKDLDFLVNAKAADISKDPKTLAEFARRAYLTAEEAVKKGNKRLENEQIRSQAGIERFELPPIYTVPRGSAGAAGGEGNVDRRNPLLR
jgi:hypothetical protein